MKNENKTLSTGVELGCWANPAGDSLPPIQLLTPEEIDELMKDFVWESLTSDNVRQVPYFNCDYCRDKKIIDVYGGPNRPCPCCSDRY